MPPPTLTRMNIDNWKKSTFCESSGCVYVGTTPGPVGSRQVHVGDGKGGMLTFTPAEWDAFLSGVKANEFDLGT